MSQVLDYKQKLLEELDQLTPEELERIYKLIVFVKDEFIMADSSETIIVIYKDGVLHPLGGLDWPERQLLKLRVEIVAQGEEEIFSPVSVHHDYYIYLKPHLQEQGLLPEDD